MIDGAAMLEALIALFILAGAFFTLAGSIGLARFPDFFMRLHGPTKATTLGVGSLLIASAAYFSWHGGHIRFQEVLIMLFLFATAPVSAHLLAKAALHMGAGCRPAAPRKRPQAPGWINAPEVLETSSADAETTESETSGMS